jgi:predicted nucleic acid-binding protein
MILVDSSVWIDFFNGRANEPSNTLANLLEEGAAPLAIADLVLFEVLRGFRHERDYLAANRAMRAIDVIAIGGEAIARSAAQHYRFLRSQGYTITSPVDLIQATFCIEQHHALLHNDQDFDAMEELRGLRVWRG